MKLKEVISSNPTLSFLDASLRGCGQVWFQNNPLSGAILFAGIFYNSLTLGICAVLGTLTSTATAYALGVDKGAIRDGLYGFNGTLTGIAIGFYFNMDPLHYAYVILASILCSVFMAALCNFLGKWNVAPLTAPLRPDDLDRSLRLLPFLRTASQCAYRPRDSCTQQSPGRGHDQPS